jgi:glycosyltransferase involved in cell wall biosynthesis
VFLHNNINLRSAWPLAIVRRPWVIVHNGCIPNDLRGWIKRRCAQLAITAAVSQDAARNIGTSTILPNCYENDLFRVLLEEKRDAELIFVGRLVSEKGEDVLLRALQQLKSNGVAGRLTIVGGGPEAVPLQNLARQLGIAELVAFAGVKRKMELVRELNRHKIMVVPSVYNEPFGIVALEGIACGCVVVGSERGGLKEAIGPCGITFPNGNASALARCLSELLSSPERLLAYRSPATTHLAKFTKAAVVEAYLKVLNGALSHSD